MLLNLNTTKSRKVLDGWFLLAHELQSAGVKPQRLQVTRIRAEVFKSLAGVEKALNV